ncbi:MAG TPA: hypothetical protein DEQ98_10095 [Acidobacteria bacterium]|nr:hypothetical protein [Acidobacteriota bacterium]MEE2965474.1 DUF948 domain-containing protein [Acidobacteriota bacterium]HCE03580.1 hypothetical protein [Acidobacteriota bacterium]
MTDWPAVFLAAIAVATGTMALIQIGVIIYGARLAWRVTKLADRVERQLDPVMDKVTQMSADASRATKLAVAQVERADEMMSRLSRRADETLDLAQQVLVVPAQRGLALIDSLRAIFSPPSEPSPQGADTDTASEASSDKDEALFVG